MEASIDLTAQDEDEDGLVDIGNDDDVDDVEEDACCICQDTVTLLKQGFLSSCDHRFHFDCIVTWSKVTNLCPLCKVKFNEVVRKDGDGAVVHKERITDAKQVFRPDPRDHDVTAQLRLVNSVRCESCGRGDDEHVLLMCEAPHCTNACHTYCAGLSEVPSHSWYCSVHYGGPASASDLITRPASTLSSRRRTRRLASLMSDVMSGSGAERRRGDVSTRPRRVRTRGRLTIPDGEGLDLGSGRPIRGVALSYAVHMSRELQAIQQRADAMFARGDLGPSALYAPPTASIRGTRSTLTAGEQRWEDRTDSQRQNGDTTALRSRPQLDLEATSVGRPASTRISPSFATEYRNIAKRMVDAASHDNYASTVSLTIPKTARLRLVSSVKSFFARLNEREKLAALDAGCLSILLSWLRVAENGGPTTTTVSKELHPHVLEAVLIVLENLPVRKEDLVEARGFQAVLDEISSQGDVSLEVRERVVVLSENWRAVNPPPAPPLDAPTNFAVVHPRPGSHTGNAVSLPAIQSFAAAAPQAAQSKSQLKMKRKRDSTLTAKSDAKNYELWSPIAVEYVKAKFYPLYKDSKGKISKDKFKAIVKQVIERFCVDAAAMQSRILDSGNTQLSSVAKKRIMQLLDQVYRESRSNLSGGHAVPSGLQSSNFTYSAVPSSVKRPRAS